MPLSIPSITSFPSSATTLIYGDGTYGQLQDSQIALNTINPTKLILPTVNPTTTYLRGDGIFMPLTTPPINNLSYSVIGNFPSTSANILYGDGSSGKLQNNQVDIGTIDPIKLILPITNPNKTDLFLRGDGLFSYVPINITTLAYNNINGFPASNTSLIYGDGTSGQLQNNQIPNNTINPLKLILPTLNQSTLYLRGDGSFQPISFSFNGDGT